MDFKMYFRIATVFPFLVTLPVFLIYTIYDNYDYQSEWIPAHVVIITVWIYGVLYSLALSACSFPIFLNEQEHIRTSWILSALCWFLLPCLFIVVLFVFSFDRSNQVYFLILNVPFLIGSMVSYVAYRIRLRKISS